jgi:hypothetical protein
MADELPDDPALWPTDPYALLGVVREVPVRDLRKAYGRLIRRFKPEQRPEEFRRIREAYDVVLAHATMREQWQSIAPPVPTSAPPIVRTPPPIIDPPAPSPKDAADADSAEIEPGTADSEREEPPAEEREIWSAAPETWTPPPPQRSLASELARLWTLAETGMVDEAYRGLRALEREHPRSQEIAIRRYWLVTAFRELEPATDPLERVLRMLADDPGQSPLWNEVRLRAQLVPNWPFSPLFDEVIEAARTPMPLSLLYDLRWQAALEIGSWRMLLDDVPTARRRFRDHPMEWTRLLLQVVDRIAWISEPAATRALVEYVAEIERHAKGDRTLDADLHRIDFLRDLASQWLGRQPKSTHEAALLDFVQISWRGHWETVRSHLIYLCGKLADDLKKSMHLLDQWSAECPLLLAQLARTVLDAQQINRPRPSSPQDTFLTFLEFCIASGGPDKWSRTALVEFFADEQILPEDLRSASVGQSVPPDVVVAIDRIEADWVVRVLARAAVCTAA